MTKDYSQPDAIAKVQRQMTKVYSQPDAIAKDQGQTTKDKFLPDAITNNQKLNPLLKVLVRATAFAVLPVFFHTSATVARFYGGQLGVCNSLVQIHKGSGNKKYK
jgi:hypothetical protein